MPWIIPFRGRNTSLATTVNFLYQEGNVYFSDNHRIALWCWLQRLPPQPIKLNLLHIDRHYDTLQANLNLALTSLPKLDGIGIQEYLDLKFDCNGNICPLIRFDTYLSIFFNRYKAIINECVFATHKEGDFPNYSPINEIESPLTLKLVSFFLKSKQPWIVNLDLDYFFTYDGGEEQQQMYPDKYIEEIFMVISEAYKAGKICVITVALSPEFCGGWSQAENVVIKFAKALGLQFSLLPDH